MLRFIKRKSPDQGNAKIESGVATNVGLVRDINEDSLLRLDIPEFAIPAGIYAVADGLGGHEGGELASQLALNIFSECVTESIRTLGKDSATLFFDYDFVSQMLIDAVQTANTEVYIQAQSKANRMGTTLAAVLVLDSKAYIVNVGDSRVYLLDDTRFHQVTKDHSLVADLVATGAISTDDIYTHPQRNIITRSLGTQNDIEVDVYSEDFKPGVYLVVCSDGLWEMVRDEQMKDIILRSGNVQDACDRLVQAANENGGVDNIAVVIAKAVL